MELSVIKEMAGKYSLQELESAENLLLNEQKPDIEIEGKDEGEQLTHVIAAIWLKKEMENEDIPLPKAMRNYVQKVRKSISD